MPIKVVPRGVKFAVTDGKRTFGTHSTKAEAEKQRIAIRINKAKKK